MVTDYPAIVNVRDDAGNTLLHRFCELVCCRRACTHALTHSPPQRRADLVDILLRSPLASAILVLDAKVRR
jgi:hypothetical protein